jgi:hypothetical protein
VCVIRTLDKRPGIFMRKTHIRQRRCYVRTMTTRVQLKKISGRDPQGAWCQELTGGKPPVVK